MKPTLILVGADKGGVGKTTITRTLVDYFTAKGLAHVLFDTEAGVGDLHRFFPQAKVIDADRVNGLVEILDNVVKAGITVVDIKAGGLSKFLTVMRDAGLLRDIHNGATRLVVLHILGSTEASLREIAATAAILIEGGEHILIKNHATDGQFFEWDKPAYDAYFAAIDPTMMLDVPHLDGLACDATDKYSASYAKFIDDEGNSRLLRGLVNNWLKKVWVSLDKAKLC